MAKFLKTLICILIGLIGITLIMFNGYLFYIHWEISQWNSAFNNGPNVRPTFMFFIFGGALLYCSHKLSKLWSVYLDTN